MKREGLEDEFGLLSPDMPLGERLTKFNQLTNEEFKGQMDSNHLSLLLKIQPGHIDDFFALNELKFEDPEFFSELSLITTPSVVFAIIRSAYDNSSKKIIAENLEAIKASDKPLNEISVILNKASESSLRKLFAGVDPKYWNSLASTLKDLGHLGTQNSKLFRGKLVGYFSRRNSDYDSCSGPMMNWLQRAVVEDFENEKIYSMDSLRQKHPSSVAAIEEYWKKELE